MRLDRRQFLLSSAATGAFALAGCAGMESRSPTARARAAYDRIFEAMLRISPETATGLGLDTGARAALKSQLSMSGPRGKAGERRVLRGHRRCARGRVPCLQAMQAG